MTAPESHDAAGPAAQRRAERRGARTVLLRASDGCALDVLFSDGSSLSTRVPDFLGSPGDRLSDVQLSEVFLQAAGGPLSAERIEVLLESTWTLESAPSLHELIALARLH